MGHGRCALPLHTSWCDSVYLRSDPIEVDCASAGRNAFSHLLRWSVSRMNWSWSGYTRFYYTFPTQLRPSIAATPTMLSSLCSFTQAIPMTVFYSRAIRWIRFRFSEQKMGSGLPWNRSGHLLLYVPSLLNHPANRFVLFGRSLPPPPYASMVAIFSTAYGNFVSSWMNQLAPFNRLFSTQICPGKWMRLHLLIQRSLYAVKTVTYTVWKMMPFPHCIRLIRRAVCRASSQTQVVFSSSTPKESYSIANHMLPSLSIHPEPIISS